jgi:hypothetical protein
MPSKCTTACADEAALRSCDSSIKRNTALLKKMRMLAEDNVDSLIKECQTVNQAKVLSPQHPA